MNPLPRKNILQPLLASTILIPPPPDNGQENAVVRETDQTSGYVPEFASDLQAPNCESVATSRHPGGHSGAFAGPLGLSKSALVRLEAAIRVQRE
jgi:hypothetical protein